MTTMLQDQLALVTGGGRGIGAAIARGLAEAGAGVIVADIDVGAAQETAQSIREGGFGAWGERLDVTDRAGLAAFAAHVADGHGALSILVNNAGVASSERISDADSAGTWDRNIAVNLTGAFDMTRSFLPALKKTRGSVINVCSVVAFTSGFAHVGYTASKGGLRSLTQAMCRELAPFGIRVNAVAPGYIDTVMGGKGDGDDRRLGGLALPAEALRRSARSGRTGCVPGVKGGKLRQRGDASRRRGLPHDMKRKGS